MSQAGCERPAPLRLGVVVPVHSDTAHATALAVELNQQIAPSLPVALVFVDNGGNEDLEKKLPTGINCVVESRRGPGHARTAGVQWFVDQWNESAVPLDQCWVISLDADSSVENAFLKRWESVICSSLANVLVGGADVQPLHGETPPPSGANLAARWLWDTALRCESLIGPVNVSGCNHAVRADVCLELGSYIQPTITDATGQEMITAGDDWDFGLRARIQGYDIGRVDNLQCKTSSRRLTENPVGYLAGRSYEGTFRHVDRDSVGRWPPAESWTELAVEATARLAAHFLIKPVLCGIPLSSDAKWFLGDGLYAELAGLTPLAGQVPVCVSGDEWVLFRRKLINRLFQSDMKALSFRLATRLQGITPS